MVGFKEDPEDEQNGNIPTDTIESVRAAEAIIELVGGEPGITAAGISEEIEMSQMRVHSILWTLLGAGSIVRVKDGRTWRYSLASPEEVA